MTIQPRDAGNTPIPLLGYRHGTGQRIDFATGSATEQSDPFNSRTKVVTAYATQDCFFAVGNVTVDANDDDGGSHFMPGSVPQDIVVGGKDDIATCISVSGANSAGTLYISERF